MNETTVFEVFRVTKIKRTKLYSGDRQDNAQAVFEFARKAYPDDLIGLTAMKIKD